MRKGARRLIAIALLCGVITGGGMLSNMPVQAVAGVSTSTSAVGGNINTAIIRTVAECGTNGFVFSLKPLKIPQGRLNEERIVSGGVVKSEMEIYSATKCYKNLNVYARKKDSTGAWSKVGSGSTTAHVVMKGTGVYDFCIKYQEGGTWYKTYYYEVQVKQDFGYKDIKLINTVQQDVDMSGSWTEKTTNVFTGYTVGKVDKVLSLNITGGTANKVELYYALAGTGKWVKMSEDKEIYKGTASLNYNLTKAGTYDFRIKITESTGKVRRLNQKGVEVRLVEVPKTVRYVAGVPCILPYHLATSRELLSGGVGVYYVTTYDSFASGSPKWTSVTKSGDNGFYNYADGDERTEFKEITYTFSKAGEYVVAYKVQGVTLYVKVSVQPSFASTVDCKGYFDETYREYVVQTQQEMEEGVTAVLRDNGDIQQIDEVLSDVTQAYMSADFMDVRNTASDIQEEPFLFNPYWLAFWNSYEIDYNYEDRNGGYLIVRGGSIVGTENNVPVGLIKENTEYIEQVAVQLNGEWKTLYVKGSGKKEECDAEGKIKTPQLSAGEYTFKVLYDIDGKAYETVYENIPVKASSYDTMDGAVCQNYNSYKSATYSLEKGGLPVNTGMTITINEPEIEIREGYEKNTNHYFYAGEDYLNITQPEWVDDGTAVELWVQAVGTTTWKNVTVSYKKSEGKVYYNIEKAGNYNLCIKTYRYNKGEKKAVGKVYYKDVWFKPAVTHVTCKTLTIVSDGEGCLLDSYEQVSIGDKDAFKKSYNRWCRHNQDVEDAVLYLRDKYNYNAEIQISIKDKNTGEEIERAYYGGESFEYTLEEPAGEYEVCIVSNFITTSTHTFTVSITD